MALNLPRHQPVRINFRVFTVLVLVAVPLLAIGGLVVLGIGQARTRATHGAHLEQIAERTAASEVTSDYFQADEEWWRETFNGRGAHISDVSWDESAKTYAIEISVPVFAPGSDEVAGVLKAVTNSSEMLASISGVRFAVAGGSARGRR